MNPEHVITFTITPSESLDNPTWNHRSFVEAEPWAQDGQQLLFVEVQRPTTTGLTVPRGIELTRSGNRCTIGPFTPAELRQLAERLSAAADEAELEG